MIEHYKIVGTVFVAGVDVDTLTGLVIRAYGGPITWSIGRRWSEVRGVFEFHRHYTIELTKQGDVNVLPSHKPKDHTGRG